MDIKKFMPLTESMFYILLALTTTNHGYGIIKSVEEMSQGRLKLAAGTLYGALSNLEKHKLIKSVGKDPDNDRRKLYLITDEGQVLLHMELNRLEELIKNGRGVLNERT